MLRIATRTLQSRLIVGTGKYATFALMREAIDASGADMVTVAVRRLTLDHPQQETLLDHLEVHWDRIGDSTGRLDDRLLSMG